MKDKIETDEILKVEIPAIEKIYPILMDLGPFQRVKVMNSLWILTGCEDLAPIVKEEESFRAREIQAEINDKRRRERAEIRAELRRIRKGAKDDEPKGEK